MYTDQFNPGIRSGTIGGTLMVLLVQVNWGSLLSTVLIAGVGATTSFLVSLGLQWLSNKLMQKAKKNNAPPNNH